MFYKKVIKRIGTIFLSMCPPITLVACTSGNNKQEIAQEIATSNNEQCNDKFQSQIKISENLQLKLHETKRPILAKQFLIKGDVKSTENKWEFFGYKWLRLIYDQPSQTLFVISLLNDHLDHSGKNSRGKGKWKEEYVKENIFNRSAFNLSHVFNDVFKETLWSILKKQNQVPSSLNIILTLGYYKKFKKFYNDVYNDSKSLVNSYLQDGKKENFIISNYDYLNIQMSDLKPTLTNKELKEKIEHYLRDCESWLSKKLRNHLTKIYNKDSEFIQQIKKIQNE